MENEWAKYKYWVMSRSQASYNTLRGMFKEGDVSKEDFFNEINKVRDIKDRKAEVNAFQHVWGYFKKVSDDSERNEYLDLIEKYQVKLINEMQVYQFLFEMSHKYNVDYLINSYYFDNLLKKYIEKYTNDMSGLMAAFSKAYNHHCVNQESPFNYECLNDWYYQFSQEQYELKTRGLPYKEYDKKILYKERLWDVDIHGEHYMFKNENIEVEVCYFDTRLIDVGFLQKYINTKYKSKLNYQDVAKNLERLHDQEYLEKSGYNYIIKIVK